ncbi:hypothetical protein BGZ83_002107 [Gryganskiella cystojenkinii]|nr:hypothetical protein BGZ83_002107 [Gryganskiella cystojenkinii]
MHSNNTQVQVIPAAFYALGPVAMSSSLGFSGGGSSSIQDHPSTLHPFHPATTAHAHHYHNNNNNGNSNSYTSNSNNHGHNNHHHNTTNPPSPVHHSSSYASSSQNNNGNSNGSTNPLNGSAASTTSSYHNVGYSAVDLNKTFDHHNQVDIYQPPPQPQDLEQLTPLMNRHLNNNHASNYHNPHHSYHQHYVAQQQYTSASSSYHNYAKSSSSSPASSVHTQSQQQQQPSSQLESYSNATTPTPSLTSTVSTTVSSASTPSLASNVSTLHNGSQDYDHHNSSSNGRAGDSRQTNSPDLSPLATSTSHSFHIPASPEQLSLGASHLNGGASSRTMNMSSWTASQNAELSSQDVPGSSSKPEQQQQRSSSFYAQPTSTTSAASTLYSQQDSQTQHQTWVASMANDEFHAAAASQELLDQQQQQQQQQHQHQQSRPSNSQRNSYNQSSTHQGPSVASQQQQQQVCGLPLLSPATLLESDYQPSYGVNMQEAPTLFSHLDYNRMSSSSMAPPSGNHSNNNKGRYTPSGPIRASKRTSSIGSQRELALGTRTRTNSVNSTTSSIASSGILSLTANMSSASMNQQRLPELSTTIEELDEMTESAHHSSAAAKFNMFQDEEEDSDSPTTIVNRPRANAAPRKAVAARVFECSIPGCNKAYTQLHNLKSHERTGHTPVIKLKPFRCIIEGCHKAFSQRKSLAVHIKNAHKEFKFKPFKCHQFGCDKAYTQLHNLRTHEKTVHLLDLSRKRVKNPNGGDDEGMFLGGGQSQHGSPYGNSPQQQHHYQPQHSRQHSDLSLGYGEMHGMPDLDREMQHHHNHPSSYPSQHHQHPQQQQHHYSRLPHMGAMSSMMMHGRP